jgi:hypothetical protein
VLPKAALRGPCNLRGEEGSRKVLKGRVSRALALAGVGMLVAVATAFADRDNRPQVDPATAEIVISHLKTKTRFCGGQDGFYQENKDAVATGTSTGDSRLSGNVTLEWDEYFNLDVDPSTGEAGPFVGEIEIRDPITGKKKAEGEFHNAGPLDMTQGVIVGKVFAEGSGDEDSTGSGDLIANWRIIYGENGSITALIGGGTAPDTRFPASISSGKCQGPFELMEADVPPPEAAALKASGAGGTRSLGFGR